MKRIVALWLSLCLLLCLAACGTEDLPAREMPEQPQAVQPVVTGSYLTETDPRIAEQLGSPVIVHVTNRTETFYAPDDSGKLILTFGSDVVKVVMDDRTAADRINQFLAMRDEMFYSGSGNGDGLNEILELATDNYAMVNELGTTQNTEFSCSRSAAVERGDSRILSIRYRVNTYTGGAHGLAFDRAYVFDAATGVLLTLDDLSTDRAALEQAMLDKMTELIETDVRYQPLQDYMTSFQSDRSMEDSLRALLREGSWLLSEEGLVVFSDLYEIGSYADGIIRFTLRYDELGELLKEDWRPIERLESGELLIRDLNDAGSSAISLLDMVSAAEDGAQFRLFSQGTVYDVSIASAVYINDHVGFYRTDTLWYCSYLSNAGVQLQTRIPDGMPDLMIRFLDADGEAHSLLLTQSAEDGAVILLEEAHVEAVG